MKLLRTLYRFSIPDAFRQTIAIRKEVRRQRQRLAGLERDFLAYFADRKELSAEEREAVEFIRRNGLAIFPYDFSLGYDRDQIQVLYDDKLQLSYVVHGTHKLYFKRGLSTRAIQSLYHGLLLDQDPESPHRYLTDEFRPDTEDIVADFGAAEGNFTLSVIETVRHAYLFEPDAGWVEALYATFAPWKDKVTIVPYFIGKEVVGRTISLDGFLGDKEPPTFLKVDIEGYEKDFLDGATHYLSQAKHLQLAICTYHKQHDADSFTDWLEKKGFSTRPSRRYMMFYFDEDQQPPYLRRGLLRATK